MSEPKRIPREELSKKQWIIYISTPDLKVGYFIDTPDCVVTTDCTIATKMTHNEAVMQATVFLDNGFAVVSICAVVAGEAIPAYKFLRPVSGFHLMFHPPYNVGEPLREAYWCGAPDMWHTYVRADAKVLTEDEAKRIQQDIKAKYGVSSRIVSSV